MANPGVYRSHIDRTADVLSHYVIPLYLDIRGHPQQVGSAFFVRAQGEYFLVTAAHVLDLGPTGALYYYVSPKVTRVVRGLALSTRGTPGERNDDPLDVAVLHLTEKVALPPYPQVGVLPFDIHELLPRATPRSPRTYILVGFPSSKNKANRERAELKAASYAYHGESPPSNEYLALGLDERSHVLVRFDPKVGYLGNGAKVQFPKPQGMSGSPIWLFDAGVQMPSDNFGFPAIGVATRHRSRAGGFIQGTDISVALDLIGKVLVRVKR